MSPKLTARPCGIIGFGRIGALYARILDRMGPRIGLSVAAVADPYSRARWTGGPHYADYRNLLALPIDTLLIATPPSSHYSIAREVLQAGKHVLLEKPPTQTVKQAQELIALSQQTGSVLFFGFHARYNQSVYLAKEKLLNCTVFRVEVVYLENVLRYHAPESWVFQEGVFKDSGINALSVLTHILPEHVPLSVTAAEFGRSPRTHTEVQVRAYLSLGETGVVSLFLDWEYTAAETRTLICFTDQGRYVVDVSADQLSRDGKVLVTGKCEGDRLECEYEDLLADFAESLQQGRSSWNTTELQLMEEAYRVGTVQAEPIGSSPTAAGAHDPADEAEI